MRPLKIDRPPDSLLKATAATGGGETKDHNPPGTYPHHQTEASKATRVQSPWHLRGHPNWTIQTVLGIHDEDRRWRKETHMKINLPIFKDEDMQRRGDLPKLEVGFDGL